MKISQAPLLTLGRGKRDFEYEALNYRIRCGDRDACTTGGIATLDRIGEPGIILLPKIAQMSDGSCDVRLETDFYIKCAALTRSRVGLPMCALNSIGEFTDRRLTLLWIGTRVVPELCLTHVPDHLHMTGAIGAGIRFQPAGAVFEVPIDALISRVTDLNDEWGDLLELRLLGPLAAYDFVVTAEPEG